MKLQIVLDLPEVGDSKITEFMSQIEYLYHEGDLSNLDDLAEALDYCDTNILSIKEVPA